MHGGVRPYGVSILYAGWDKHLGFQLYQVKIRKNKKDENYFKIRILDKQNSIFDLNFQFQTVYYSAVYLKDSNLKNG